MQLTFRPNVTYAFVILALGMMLTDFCRLLQTPSTAALSASSKIQHVRKF
jgi:hypothetical protein